MARMTRRQKEGKKISKKRAARKRWQTVYRRLVAAVALLAVAGSGGGVWWLWRSGEISEQYRHASAALLEATADAGFAVEHIYLGGRKHTPMKAVEDAIMIEPGDPLFSLSPRVIRERLEALPRVKLARVERVLPDRLHIQILEREPIAVWQYQEKLHLIDDEGVVIGGERIADYRHLPLVVGEDAPKHTAELLKILAGEPELMRRVEAAVRVSGRRWNLRFDNGVEAKLPAAGAGDAWRRLARLEAQDNLLQRNIISIDLRIDNHMYIKVPPDEVAPQDNHKKETRA